jgi:predicted GIY-YIG superfamily endonuclease
VGGEKEVLEKERVLAKSKEKQYIYIVQSSKETTKCKIGKTNSLERRLKEYNNMLESQKKPFTPIYLPAKLKI